MAQKDELKGQGIRLRPWVSWGPNDKADSSLGLEQDSSDGALSLSHGFRVEKHLVRGKKKWKEKERNYECC